MDFEDDEVTSQLSGAVRSDNTNDLLVRLLGREASTRPTMVVLEDARRFDSASWSLVLQMRRRVDPAAGRTHDAAGGWSFFSVAPL